MVRKTEYVRPRRQTYLGVVIDALDMHPDHIHILDIAHSLSYQCVHGGHVERFLSKAELAVHLSNNVSKENALWALLSVGHEAYLYEFQELAMANKGVVDYLAASHGIYCKMVKTFHIPLPFPNEVTTASTCFDLFIQKQNRKPLPPDWVPLEKTPPHAITGALGYWNPHQAKVRFLLRFFELTSEEFCEEHCPGLRALIQKEVWPAMKGGAK